jgi:hypothetical protein
METRMKEQLSYWESECEKAQRCKDAKRVSECERHIAQCSRIIAMLSMARLPSASGDE